MKINTKKILQNKFVLYLVFFLALTSIFGYLINNNCQAILLFILIGILTHYFSKNMIVILTAATLGTHLVTFINSSILMNNTREGLANNDHVNELQEALTRLTPKKINNSDDNLDIPAEKPEHDKVEAAYDLLEQQLGGGGKGGESGKDVDILNSDILGKQADMMKKIKQMTPILKQTMGLVRNIDMDSILRLVDNISNVIPDTTNSESK